MQELLNHYRRELAATNKKLNDPQHADPLTYSVRLETEQRVYAGIVSRLEDAIEDND